MPFLTQVYEPNVLTALALYEHCLNLKLTARISKPNVRPLESMEHLRDLEHGNND